MDVAFRKPGSVHDWLGLGKMEVTTIVTYKEMAKHFAVIRLYVVQIYILTGHVYFKATARDIAKVCEGRVRERRHVTSSKVKGSLTIGLHGFDVGMNIPEI
jgi:hypothetical protein